ncbi:bromodomain-containing protein 7 [Stomoxys calcitrans]|uniref:bromodomain-containing protein 7 n=1 Tax=Stomoxys calcitrans TaxID=35570 RepID=UPI0027E306D0|nr:bromodomain-containing protein 7 [Stomoxys calcitrans]
MGSSKKHKKHKLERREKYEEYSHNTDPSSLQRGLKLILKVGPNNTPEYGGADVITSSVAGPPTAAEAMCSSPLMMEDIEEHREKHKKSKKKKKKKDREKKHKHHKEKKRDKGERHVVDESPRRDTSSMDRTEDLTLIANQDSQSLPSTSFGCLQRSPKVGAAGPPSNIMPSIGDGDSSQDGFSFMDDDNSQPLPEHVLLYAGITTENSQSCRPVSKPIVPIKTTDEVTLDSPASSSIQSSSVGNSLGAATCAGSEVPPENIVANAQPADGSAPGAVTVGSISPTKPLAELIIPSLSPSASDTTPGGSNSLAALTPKVLEAPRTPSSSSESGREPRTCVLKLKHQKTSLNKLLEHLLRGLEKRDPHQFFAWPVTDDIAPGYSKIIARPMDFSTMRQKIDDNDYATLNEFTEDFRLMCENAIRYNHVDTVYHKAAKRLLQVGMKHLSPENLMRSLKPTSGYLRDLTAKELGFELIPQSGDFIGFDHHGMADSADEGASTGAEEPMTQAQIEEEEKRKAIRLENEPKTRFEPYVDDLTSEEILAQVQGAAQSAKKRLSAKEKAYKMGFLRQNKDGSTSLNFLIKDENEGPEKVVCLGELVGKLKQGSGQVQGYREDKRNEAKMVKPLNYGPFSSFAPTFDSRFSTLNKDETQLVMETYGDAMSTEYAESILQFTKDSSYATMLANGLLDMLTNGEHSKCMQDLYDLQVQNYEQQEALKCFTNAGPLLLDSSSSPAPNESRAQIEQEYEKYKNTRIDFSRLRTLNDLGIDTTFLNDIEKEMKNFELTRRLQEHLSNNLNLIDKLKNTQHERLSQPLPHHLGLVQQASQEETQLAHQVTQNLTDVVKKLPPSAVADPYALRKAMGLSYVGLPPPPSETQQRIQLPAILQQPVTMPPLAFTQSHPSTTSTATSHVTASSQLDQQHNLSSSSLSMDIDEDVAGNAGGDLENELREFLESGSGLHAASSSTADDNNLMAQLLMN